MRYSALLSLPLAAFALQLGAALPAAAQGFGVDKNGNPNPPGFGTGRPQIQQRPQDDFNRTQPQQPRGFGENRPVQRNPEFGRPSPGQGGFGNGGYGRGGFYAQPRPYYAPTPQYVPQYTPQYVPQYEPDEDYAPPPPPRRSSRQIANYCETEVDTCQLPGPMFVGKSCSCYFSGYGKVYGQTIR